MKTIYRFVSFLLISILLAGCIVLPNAGVKIITPSDTIISENRDVSGFKAIDFSAMGKIIITQGAQESLAISGPDNIVPEISTAVSSGTLTIKTKRNITVPTLRTDLLTFTIMVKDLDSLNVSGLGDVQLESLSAPRLDINMSGAGRVIANKISTTDLNINMSGAGGMDLSGEAANATIKLSGAGSVNSPDLKIQNADVNLSGLGGATLWVTSQLTGEISGVGGVSYYGNPQANTKTSGLGAFKSLGDK